MVRDGALLTGVGLTSKVCSSETVKRGRSLPEPPYTLSSSTAVPFAGASGMRIGWSPESARRLADDGGVDLMVCRVIETGGRGLDRAPPCSKRRRTLGKTA